MSYKTELQENNADLQTLLYVVNALPESTPTAVLYTAQTLTDEQKAQARANIGVQGSIHVSASAPTDTSMLWVDTGNNGMLKYYNTATSSWKVCSAVWS